MSVHSRLDRSPPSTAPEPSLRVSGPPAVKHARAGLFMSVATFSMAAASAIQAVLYLSSFGVDGRTDGFFVAFAIYTTFGVFSQCLRLTSVPLLVEPRPRLTPREFAGALVLIALPVLVATTVLAGPLARLLAPGLSVADRAVTEAALPILGAAVVLQLWAAGAATLLAIRDRFATVAGAYIAGAASGLVAYVALEPRAEELTLGWSMLAMAVVTATWMLIGLWGAGGLGGRPGALGPRRVLARAGHLLGRTAVYLAFNALYLITLAYVSRFAAGDATVLSYAYLYASYLVAGTGMALGMSRIPDMTRGARAARRAVIEETVPQGFRYAMLLVAPALALLITAGAPLIHELFPASLDVEGVATLRTFTALLVPWTFAALVVSLLLPAMFALGRARLLNALAVPLVLVDLGATMLGSELFGVWGAVGAFCIAPLAFAAVLIITGAGAQSMWLTRLLARDAVRFTVLAAGAYGAGAALGAAVADGLPAAVLAGCAGTALYVIGARLVAAHQFEVLAGALRPSSA